MGSKGMAGQVRLIPGFLLGDVNGDGVQDYAIELTGISVLSATDFIF